MTDLPTDKLLMVLEYDRPIVVGAMNLYDPGDVWVKISGCESCGGMSVCCGKCPFLMEDRRCLWHVEGRRSRKPFNCCVDPHPRHACSYCNLAYECIQGPKKGKRRYVCDPRDILR